jgi:hypothetical protein
MKVLDQIFACLMIVLGAIHSAFTFAFYKSFGLPALWFFSAGFVLILAGFINLLRVQGKSTGLLRFTSILGNLAAAVIAIGAIIATGGPPLFRQNPQVPMVAIVVFIELVFSFRGGR